MNTQMIPCRSPQLCGVHSHRPGTEAQCQANRSDSGDQPKANLLGAVPKPVTSGTDYESDANEPINASDLKELHELQAKVDKERTRLVQIGHKQIEDAVRKEMNLTDEDKVEVVPGTLLHPVNRLTVSITKKGQREMRAILRQSKYIANKPKEGEVSTEEINRFNDDRDAVNEQYAAVVKGAQMGIENWVAKRVRKTPYDEVRIHDHNVVGDSEFVSANLYNNGVDVGYYRIPRSDIFPE